MRSLANWLKLLSLKPSSHSRCSSALSSSLFHGAATPPSPATPTPASLQVTSITPLQHPHQHPYRSPLYPLPCNTHTSIPTGHLYTPSPATPTPASLQVTSLPPPLQHQHQHPYRSPLYPLPCNTHTSIPTGHLYTPSPATPTPASLQVTSLPPPLQHQHPYRSPLYPLPCNTHTIIPASGRRQFYAHRGFSVLGLYVQSSNQPRHAHAAFPQLYYPTSHVRPSQIMSENIKHQRKTQHITYSKHGV